MLYAVVLVDHTGRSIYQRVWAGCQDDAVDRVADDNGVIDWHDKRWLVAVKEIKED